MPCAYRIEGSNPKCQFNTQEDEFIVVDDHTWCPFHAPLQGASGNPTQKGSWAEHEIDHFYKKISALRENAITENKSLNLSGVVFPDDANFHDLEFPEVDFSFCNFTGAVAFLDARFKGRTDFRSAIFKTDTDFTGARFSGNYVHFNEARFERGVVFSNAVFDKIVFFPQTKFRGHSAQFIGTQFNAQAEFYEAEFNASTEFQHAKFKGNANFSNTKFNKSANFFDAQFGREACFISDGSNHEVQAFMGVVFFEKAEFIGAVMFDNRQFQQRTEFRNCIFHNAPSFYGCLLHQYTDFTDARFLDTSSPGAAMAYRTLKLDMEGKRAREEHLMFYALEMESRQRTTKRKLLKFISWLYGMTADYGQSIIAPFASALLVVVLSMIVYSIFFLASPIANIEKIDIVVLTSRFSLEQIIRPFRALENSPSLSGLVEVADLSNIWRLCLGITTTIQSVLGFVFLGLGALAVRWRFKIG